MCCSSARMRSVASQLSLTGSTTRLVQEHLPRQRHEASSNMRTLPVATSPPPVLHRRVSATPPPTPNFWHGEIAKSSVTQSRVHILSANATCREQSRLWPLSLDMQHRMAIDQVVALWNAHEPSVRGWCWMRPNDASDEGFATFLMYLTQRQRAGIVKPQLTEEGCMHALYLVPATTAVCELLAIPFEEGALLVLVLEIDD
jgi:hypothetical protein